MQFRFDDVNDKNDAVAIATAHNYQNVVVISENAIRIVICNLCPKLINAIERIHKLNYLQLRL